MNDNDSEDLFSDWRGKRFVMLEHALFGRWTMILTDYTFWADELEALHEWCDDYGANPSGMVVEFPDEQTLTLFALRWA
jgi:hypothetical protein